MTKGLVRSDHGIVYHDIVDQALDAGFAMLMGQDHSPLIAYS